MRNIAILYTNEVKFGKKPFKENKLNKTYELFSDIARKKNLKAFLTDYRYYTKGSLKKAWVFEKIWKKVSDIKVDVAYDKFELDNKTMKLKKEIYNTIGLVNIPELEKICKDKWIIAKLYPKLVPKTFLVHNKTQLKKVLPKIKTKKVVLKPRYGLGGEGIKITNKNKLPAKISRDTIIQEYVDVSKGLDKFNIKGAYDLRIIIINGKLDHAYFRIARKGLLSNVALGAEVRHIKNNSLIPKSIKDACKIVDAKFKKFKPRIYTADFIITKENKLILVEINGKPGLYLYYTKEDKKIQKNLFIKIILVLKSSIRKK